MIKSANTMYLTHENITSIHDGNPIVAKTVAMIVLFGASFGMGTFAIKLNKWFDWSSEAKNNDYIKMLLGMGGGVLLCTTFLHLLPEVNESFEDLNLTPNLELHYAEILMCFGFFTMYFVEECVHLYLHRKEKLHENLRAVRRSLMIRRGELEDEKPITEKAPVSLEHHDRRQHEHEHHHHHDHQHEHEHGDHSHIPVFDGEDSAVKTIRGLLVVLALSVHELFEGLAVGLEPSTAAVWYMFGAVSAHKLVIAFCIGVELVTSGLKNTLIIIYVFTFAVVSPLGIGVGIAVTKSGEDSTTLISVILQGMASGTLLYVVFFEILQADRKSGLKQFSAVFVGFLIMFGITLFD